MPALFGGAGIRANPVGTVDQWHRPNESNAPSHRQGPSFERRHRISRSHIGIELFDERYEVFFDCLKRDPRMTGAGLEHKPVRLCILVDRPPPTRLGVCDDADFAVALMRLQQRWWMATSLR